MATTKEINQYLKENDYTEADMNRFWNECIEVNDKVRLLSNAGKTWKDLPINQIEKLPKLKKKTLKKLKKAQKAEKKEQEKQALKRQETYATESEQDYEEDSFSDAFAREMLAKIDAGVDLTRGELSELCEYELEHEADEPDRWTRPVTSIIELCGRHFSLAWNQGLTEYQEDQFDNQPYEVEERTYEKTITVTEWLPIDKEEELER